MSHQISIQYIHSHTAATRENQKIFKTTIYGTNYPKLPNYQTWFLSFKRYQCEIYTV